jgi:hypothetical protein
VGELLKQENLLPFNRKIKESHANGIRDSLLTYGLIKPPVLVVLKYDNDKKAIGDGQHTLTALYSLMKSNDLVEVSVIKCNTKRDVIDLIAKLNTTGKGWVLDDFFYIRGLILGMIMNNIRIMNLSKIEWNKVV